MLTQLTRLLISRHKDIRLVSPLLWQTDVSPALFPLPRSLRLSHCSPCFSIQDNNPWARALYEGLGYAAWKRERASWPYEDEVRVLRLYETELVVLRKALLS